MTAVALAVSYKVYTNHRGPVYNNPSQTIQQAKDAVQQDTDYQNRVQDTVHDQLNQ